MFLSLVYILVDVWEPIVIEDVLGSANHIVVWVETLNCGAKCQIWFIEVEYSRGFEYTLEEKDF